jgi:hypothetical protein
VNASQFAKYVKIYRAQVSAVDIDKNKTYNQPNKNKTILNYLKKIKKNKTIPPFHFQSNATNTSGAFDS